MWAGATSMPALSVGRMTSPADRPSARTSAIDRSTVLRLIPSPAVIALGVHVDAQDPQPLLGQRTREIDRRGGLADAALLVGDRDHIGHQGITSNHRQARRRAVRQQRDVAMLPQRTVGRTRWLSTRIGSCSPFRWIIADRMMASVLAQRQAFAAEDRPCRRIQERSARLDARAESLLGGGQERIDQQHARGKLTARERLDLLLDAGSFVELDAFVTNRNPEVEMAFLGDGVVTGHGAIDGRLVFVFSQDFTVFGGSLSEAYAEKICKVMDLATKVGAPIIGLNDSGGARIQEGAAAWRVRRHLPAQHARVRCRAATLGRHGPVPGSGTPAITDFTIMVEGTSYMFVTGPNVVKAVTHEDVDAETLGGATTHTTRSGVAHIAAHDEAEALAYARRVLAHLPQNNLGDAPRGTTTDPADRRDVALDAIVPDDPSKPYDMHRVIELVVDVVRDPARLGPRTSSCLPRLGGRSSVSSRSSPRSSPARSTSMRRPRQRDPCGRAIASTSRC